MWLFQATWLHLDTVASCVLGTMRHLTDPLHTGGHRSTVSSKGDNLTFGSGSKNRADKVKCNNSTSPRDTPSAFMGSGQFSLTTVLNVNITERVLRFCPSHVSHTHLNAFCVLFKSFSLLIYHSNYNKKSPLKSATYKAIAKYSHSLPLFLPWWSDNLYTKLIFSLRLRVVAKVKGR